MLKRSVAHVNYKILWITTAYDLLSYCALALIERRQSNNLRLANQTAECRTVTLFLTQSMTYVQ